MEYSTAPPIARQSRHQHHSRRKEGQPLHSSSTAHRHDRGLSSSHGSQIAPASPEVISSLITSLSIISKPASSHFDSPLGSAVGFPDPTSPAADIEGSFGVDYGAYAPLIRETYKTEEISLDDLAASPPVIRTAKPPSGFSPLTAPKSPGRESSGEGRLKSLLSAGRSSISRPSSKGSSLASRDADTQSIGNLSIERGTTSPIPELKERRSHDSWGKKTSRSHKGLMYMSSKERLREKEAEKRRASIGAVGGDRLAVKRALSPRPDPFLAETAISEEPHTDHSTHTKDAEHKMTENGVTSPRPIPTRDSSLRKTSSNAKRSSKRSSKRHSDSPDVIVEGKVHDNHNSNHRNSHRDSSRRREDERSGRDSKTPDNRHRPHEGKSLPVPPDNHADIEEDGAPFPNVSQNRRREHSNDGRRRSGRHTPEPIEGLKPKRSSSRLKRLSAPLSPRPDDTSADESAKRKEESAVAAAHVSYERPHSADSIDDAVESYLCSPRLSQKIKHPQTGRVISFSEVGDSEGSAVFCCVGMGLTRYITAFYDELALTLKLRLITPDRPGIGDSESYEDGTATPLSWPDDVYAICQALKITKFSILAHSAGAIYALATALRMPQHIRGRIHLLAPWIPPSQMSVFGASAQTPLPPTNAIPTSQRILRALPTPLLKAANSSFMTATSSSITSSLPKTTKRKRKSTANLRADKAAAAAAAPPLPTDNKENHNHPDSKHNPPVVPPKESITEEMDRIRPLGASPTPTGSNHPMGTDSSSSAGVHRKTSSTASAAHAAREAAVLAAAASALADKERQENYDTRLTHAIWELATTGANPAVDLLVCLERRHTIGFRYVDITRPVVIHHGSRDTRVPVENVRWLGKTMRRCEVRVLEGEGHGLMASAAVMGSVLMEISKEWEDWGRLTGVSGRKGDRRAGGGGDDHRDRDGDGHDAVGKADYERPE
ncbi:uncharacterized protein E0L32_007716 [Thyridium curvatum]|uniref:AB hydrolase-1 domain-containing protein n=1 Tax=Thyridium curvatum TaxID=1093900 RepID=A0A507ALL2_9PEZI|nr:uncharacterized protein E0L32_007716 [Thyridium curvatum]TPX11505.1 hypothetical protein E0L32_007716 [Thyridium curvatum]